MRVGTSSTLAGCCSVANPPNRLNVRGRCFTSWGRDPIPCLRNTKSVVKSRGDVMFQGLVFLCVFVCIEKVSEKGNVCV